MFRKKIKISDELYSKLEKAASLTQCAGAEALALQILEIEAERIISSSQSKELSDTDVDAIANQLKGLGYLE